MAIIMQGTLWYIKDAWLITIQLVNIHFVLSKSQVNLNYMFCFYLFGEHEIAQNEYYFFIE